MNDPRTDRPPEGTPGPSGQTSGPSSHAAPVFSPPRRGRRPGRSLVVGALAIVGLLGAVFGAWLRMSGRIGGDGGEPAIVSDSIPAGAPPADTAPPPPPPPVRLAFAVEPAGAAVTVDDSLAVSADAGALLAVGSHRVRAEAAGYLPVDTVVELVADDSLRLVLERAPPTTGTISASANLAGRVLVNGRDRGAAPLRGLEVRPGSYTVRFVPGAGDGLAEERAVRVRAGDDARVTFEVTDALVSVGVRQPRWATVYAGEVRLGDTPLIEHRLPARVYTLRVARDGYETRERLVRLAPGESFQWVDVELAPEGNP